MADSSFFRFAFPEVIGEGELSALKDQPASFWEEEGKIMAKKLFSFTRETVPAYKDFLEKNNVSDFINTPPVTKDNYLRNYPYLDLFPFQQINNATTICSTSGSTGDPFYFPRGEEEDRYYEKIAEIFLKNQFEIDKKRTLGIIGFAFGVWIGGIFTYKNFNKIAKTVDSFTLIPVGANKEIYLKSFKKFAPFYDQIILMGYPPFIKDILDNGRDHGIEWKNHNIRILTAAEGYSENFRNYLIKKGGLKNSYNDLINIYGTVEQGTIAHETALASLIRSVAVKDKKVFKEIFLGAKSVPTLAQYYPPLTYFEPINGELMATGYGSSIPLVRYKFSDLGGVIPFQEMTEKLKKFNIDILAEAEKVGISESIMKLPFVYTYARADFIVVFRGANIYPGQIRNALDKEILAPYLTGRATIIRKEDRKLNQILEVNVELQQNVEWTNDIRDQVTEIIIKDLCKYNSEYNYLYSMEPEKVVPQVVGWPYHDHKYFSTGGKQAWVKKEKNNDSTGNH